MAKKNLDRDELLLESARLIAPVEHGCTLAVEVVDPMDAIQKELSEIKKRLNDLESPQRAAPSTGVDPDYFPQTRQLEELVRLAAASIAFLKERDPATYRDIAGRYKRLEKNARNGVSLATEWLVPLEDS